ncbi:protein arginine kinase [Clostridium cavendishii DSM 21758]|uniref:Protein-arginine kinase n=1 Tax=Clostridium cavendishii DSM 21758 TaxID=1121302 RepID=A0A1M6V109_9CLOT|nr:protein arginine kinase [Clostridium cavendishii]SHK75182.1 protein arginine kinase [Clostridium cavendishii DSM 21758]
MKNWITDIGDDKDIVISSRIRIARNISSIPFPNKLTIEKGKESVENIGEAILRSEELKDSFKFHLLWEEDIEEESLYLEKHLISGDLLKKNNNAGFFVNKEETISIMLNEEDHIRIQCINKGFNLRDTYKEADRIDSLLEEELDYAFDEKFGYLTACPTNLGTGMRASVMMHLPALTINEEITALLKGLTQVGMTLRGVYGEGTRADGNLYQISNQISLGVTEEETLSNLEAVVSEIILQENKAREKILLKNEYELKDKIYRSIGILKNSILLDTKEALELLSNVRMGVEMGIVEGIDTIILNKLLVEIQPATLKLKLNRKLSEAECNLERARIVRETLSLNKEG